MKKRILYIMCMLTNFVLSSCEHKDLCYHHPHMATIKVAFDWTNAPSADPDGMCLFFYPIDEEKNNVQRFDIRGKTGGIIKVQTGKYRVICYNNDTEAMFFRGMNHFDTHEGFTREGGIFESVYGRAVTKAPQAKGAEDECVMICPDMLYGCCAFEIEITESSNTEKLMMLYPYELVCTYTYEIRNVKNLKHATQMCGSLSSMAPSLFFSTEDLGTECVTIPLETHSDGISTITGKFYTFGHHPENITEHRMLLYIWMDDGNKYYYGSSSEKFNVTEQIHTAPDKRHVQIIIDGLDLPQPIEDGSGFDPSVDDWQDVEQDINM
ncbi:DUF5119 domain-containing protein [Bacteroides sp.]|uniref:DUF5119 domain-containing protein n=1 Tax=Bacteroides sp. TaxID=29523 RepID=UPI0026241B76|nr:DUF5119 domain-containing protein [Bacteroides sp.]MDD3036782.1 DUF5119 domain-containing protein [Bacteroides sp.]